MMRVSLVRILNTNERTSSMNRSISRPQNNPLPGRVVKAEKHDVGFPDQWTPIEWHSCFSPHLSYRHRHVSTLWSCATSLLIALIAINRVSSSFLLSCSRSKLRTNLCLKCIDSLSSRGLHPPKRIH